MLRRFPAASPPDERAHRRRRKAFRFAVGATLVCLAALAGYSVLVEPNRLEVTRHSLVGPVRAPLRIAHLSDLHTKGFGPREQTVVALLRQEKPDVVVVTGDIVDDGRLVSSRDFFANLSAPLGVWVVRGNWERWSVRESEAEFFAPLGVGFLDNTGKALRPDVWLAGLDDPASGEPNLTKALEGAPAAAFKVVLFHAPDYFRDVAGSFNLALAGHTHGGQVALPLVGPLWRPEGGRIYLKGWSTKNGSHLYVNRGVGTSIAPIRLLARPEIAIIDVLPPS